MLSCESIWLIGNLIPKPFQHYTKFELATCMCKGVICIITQCFPNRNWPSQAALKENIKSVGVMPLSWEGTIAAFQGTFPRTRTFVYPNYIITRDHAEYSWSSWQLEGCPRSNFYSVQQIYLWYSTQCCCVSIGMAPTPEHLERTPTLYS